VWSSLVGFTKYKRAHQEVESMATAILPCAATAFVAASLSNKAVSAGPAVALPAVRLCAFPKLALRSVNESKQRVLRAAAEETTSSSAEGEVPVEEAQATEEDMAMMEDDEALAMYLKVEGFMSEGSIPKLSKALEAEENLSNIQVKVVEGCGIVQCTKLTTVRATGVASGLVNLMQQNGLTVQTLSLGFDDEAEPQPDFFDFKSRFSEDTVASGGRN